MIDLKELSAWLRLLLTPSLRRTTARRLLGALGSPQAVFATAPQSLTAWVTPKQAAALANPPQDFESTLQRTVSWLNEPGGERHHALPLGDPRYPAALLESGDPPLLLFAQGKLDLLSRKVLAVVGSRNPTPQGEENAKAFSASLSQQGWTIASGLAQGIDGAAHEGALQGPGSTIAVVGTGLDRVYPKMHLSLAHRIAELGLLLSEYPPGTPPLAAHFPQRNRIIAGLANGTLVVEAALKSGSLITARLAVECGREVFAIPGSIHAPQYRGCHALLKQGAKLVENAEDILEELQPSKVFRSATPTSFTSLAPNHPILNWLGFDPITLDDLSGRSGMSAADLNVQLLDLELQGQVARLPGQMFQRLASA